MRPRLIIVLSVLVLLPISLLTWLGVRSAGNERQLVEHQFQDVIEGRLHDLDQGVQQIVEGVERRLLLRTQVVAPRTDLFREIVRTEPLIRQVFWVAADGRLMYPPPAGPLTQEESDFIVRTKPIWEREAVLYEPASAEGAPGTKKINRGPSDIMTTAPTGDSLLGLAKHQSYGWISWYWEEGLHLLFWRRAPAGGVLGVEVERIVLLSRVVAALPSAGLQHGRIVLTDSRQEPVYQWGPYEVERGAAPFVQRALTAPLNAWNLQYFASPELEYTLEGNAQQLGILGGVAAMALVLLGLGVYAYREYARDLREAAKRVSFVTQVSHELKTPLTNIRLYAEMLEDRVEGDEQSESKLAVIVQESQRLSRLIGNILTFSKQNNDRIEVIKKPISIDDLVSTVAGQFGPSLASREIEVSLDLESPEPVMADADAVGQILANLIGNVEKYAAAGGRVEIRTTQDEHETRVMVIDEGPGVPPALADKIFEPFFRASDRLTDGVAGTGIGLSIARTLARLHGGDLSVEPSDRGACFLLMLPSGGAS